MAISRAAEMHLFLKKDLHMKSRLTFLSFITLHCQKCKSRGASYCYILQAFSKGSVHDFTVRHCKREMNLKSLFNLKVLGKF